MEQSLPRLVLNMLVAIGRQQERQAALCLADVMYLVGRGW